MSSTFAVSLLALSFLQTPPAPAPAPSPAPAPAQEAPKKVAWFKGSLEKALEEAKSSNKLVYADFGASWCSWCIRMDREVFSSDEGLSALEPVICVKVDYDKQRDTCDRYLVGKELPVSIWFNADASVRERIDGYQDQSLFLANASRIKNDLGTINELRRRVASNPADLDGRFELHRKLKSVGDAAGAAEQRAAIEKADPLGDSRAMHHFKFDTLMAGIQDYWAKTKSLDLKQIEGLRVFLEGESDPEIMWDGWMSLSNTYNYFADQAQARGDAAEAKKNRGIQRQFLARAWRGIPQDDDTLRGHVTGYAALFWDLKDELSADDKSLMLTMTEMTARRLDREPLVQQCYARALFLNGKTDAAQAACERAIELAKATSQDPQNYEKDLELFGGAPAK
ncbi:MAG: DUF255 domain-containing protein [Planctomycetes bacterium]|nr:DUF255 domain-containing protein [Planctomycetota bacterium]